MQSSSTCLLLVGFRAVAGSHEFHTSAPKEWKLPLSLHRCNSLP